MMRFPEITAILFIGIYKIPPELIVFRYIFTDCLLRNMDFFHDPLLFFQRKMMVASLPHGIFREINTPKPLLNLRIDAQKFNHTPLNSQIIQLVEIHVFLDDGA